MHLLACGFFGEIRPADPVEFVEIFQIVFNHFVHRDILQKSAVFETVDAIFFVFASVGVRAEMFLLCERHPAALAYQSFHNNYIFQVQYYVQIYLKIKKINHHIPPFGQIVEI